MIPKAYIQGEVEQDYFVLSCSNNKVLKLIGIINIFQVEKLYNKKIHIFFLFKHYGFTQILALVFSKPLCMRRNTDI